MCSPIVADKFFGLEVRGESFAFQKGGTHLQGSLVSCRALRIWETLYHASLNYTMQASASLDNRHPKGLGESGPMDGAATDSKSGLKLQLSKNEGLPFAQATKMGVFQPTNGTFLRLQDSITWPPSSASSTGNSTKPMSDSVHFQPRRLPSMLRELAIWDESSWASYSDDVEAEKAGTIRHPW